MSARVFGSLVWLPLLALGCQGSLTHATYDGEATIRLSPVAGDGVQIDADFADVWIADQYNPVDETWGERTFVLETQVALTPCVDTAVVAFARDDYRSELFIQEDEASPFGILWYSDDDQPETDLETNSGAWQIDVQLEESCLGEGLQDYTLEVDWSIDPSTRTEHRTSIGEIWPVRP